MENREITFLSHYRYVINNEDKTKPVVSQNMLFEALLSNLIVTAPHLHFCMYSIFIYVPFSKYLGTDILATPICVH